MWTNENLCTLIQTARPAASPSSLFQGYRKPPPPPPHGFHLKHWIKKGTLVVENIYFLNYLNIVLMRKVLKNFSKMCFMGKDYKPNWFCHQCRFLVAIDLTDLSESSVCQCSLQSGLWFLRSRDQWVSELYLAFIQNKLEIFVTVETKGQLSIFTF